MKSTTSEKGTSDESTGKFRGQLELRFHTGLQDSFPNLPLLRTHLGSSIEGALDREGEPGPGNLGPAQWFRKPMPPEGDLHTGEHMWEDERRGQAHGDAKTETLTTGRE